MAFAMCVAVVLALWRPLAAKLNKYYIDFILKGSLSHSFAPHKTTLTFMILHQPDSAAALLQFLSVYFFSWVLCSLLFIGILFSYFHSILVSIFIST